MANRGLNSCFLKSQSDYTNISKSGRKIKADGWLLGLFVSKSSGHFRVGWTIPTYVGTAVTRNRFKRWLRVYFQRLPVDISGLKVDMNLIFRKEKKSFYSEMEHKDFDQAITNLLSKVKDRSAETRK